MRFLSSIRIVRVTLAFAVAFWMAGGGCMLGCENMAGAASETEAPATPETPENGANLVVAPDACASMHGHGCCSKRGSQPMAKSGDNSSAQRVAKLSGNAAHSSRASSSPDAARSSAHSSRHSSSANAALPQTAAGLVDISALAAPFTSMMDCPLAVNATAALSKARPDDSGGDLLPASSLDSFSIFKEQLTALTPPPLVPNRGHTYLRCCVFLI
jgi:hypothetical protein